MGSRSQSCKSQEGRAIKAVLAVVAAVAFAAMNATPAAATHVRCGQTITEDTALDSDLIDCDVGLVIGADNVTLDLNGHVLDGDPDSGIGIRNAGHAGVTIENGSIQQFGHRMLENYVVYLNQTHGNVLRNLSLSDYPSYGIFVTDSFNTIVEKNSLDSLGHVSSWGIVCGRFCNDNVIRGNFISRTPTGGIGVGTFSQGNRILNNVLVGTRGTRGIYISNETFENTVQKNTVEGASIGLVLSDFADRNLIARNSFDRNGTGIRVDDDTHDNVIRSNSMSENFQSGLLVSSVSFGTLVARNVASRNGEDGIRVLPSSDPSLTPTTLARNTANENGDLGIEASPGVIDGGGNRAARNGNPLQCTSVSCK